jgi:hypothetical protein
MLYLFNMDRRLDRNQTKLNCLVEGGLLYQLFPFQSSIPWFASLISFVMRYFHSRQDTHPNDTQTNNTLPNDTA